MKLYRIMPRAVVVAVFWVAFYPTVVQSESASIDVFPIIDTDPLDTTHPRQILMLILQNPNDFPVLCHNITMYADIVDAQQNSIGDYPVRVRGVQLEAGEDKPARNETAQLKKYIAGKFNWQIKAVDHASIKQQCEKIDCNEIAINEINALWQKLDKNCSNADSLMESVEGLLHEGTGIKFTGECSEKYDSTLRNELGKIMNHCGEECIKIGQAAGSSAAVVFCAVAVIGHTPVFSGLKDVPTNIFCGEFYRMSCQSTFIAETTQACPNYAQGEAFEKYYRANIGGVLTVT